MPKITPIKFGQYRCIKLNTHSFETEIAKHVGVNAAVIFCNIEFWCDKNKANKKNLYDGRYWTYNSVRAWSELFPYLSQRQIKTAIDKLIEIKLIFKGNYNKSAYDRTMWYSINHECKFHFTKMSNGIDQNVEPIPDINTDISTYSKNSCDLQSPKSKVSNIPYGEIVNLYHEILASLPRVKKLTDARKKALKARHINELNSNLENWQGYFEHIFNNCKWMLTGQYSIDFDYVINLKNYVSIIEGAKSDR